MSTKAQLIRSLTEYMNKMDILTKRLNECQRRGLTLLSRILTGQYDPEPEDEEIAKDGS